MSAIKRPRPRQAGPRSASPSSKRLKASHGPAQTGLESLVDENARTGKKLTAKLTNGVGKAASHRVDESRTLAAQDSSAEDEANVRKTQKSDVISISSGDESSDLEDEDEDDDVAGGAQQQGLSNGHASAGGEQAAAADDDDLDMADADVTSEPTFGDLLQARHGGATIDVQKTLQREDGTSSALMPTDGRKVLQLPTAGSLGTVLTQALKTNDKDLLESCFAMPDVNAIRATIQRQQSPQIATLLQRIAERIHKRPGRAGRLMIWIQWSLVTHGGYLANQPELMKKLKALAQVTRERANGLQPLLHLKGKLDLLSAQLEARRSMQAQSRAANADDMDDEQDVLYIEGQDTAWSSDDEAGAANASSGRSGRKKLLPAVDNESGQESGGDADLPNGFINGIEDDSSADEDDERHDGLVDDEAEEASSDEEDSDEEAQSDASSEEEEDSSGDDESEVEAVKQPKPQTLNRKR
ncbi:Putative small-subunit processome, Utp12 protein [Septoria linicola]|uniref:Small-subunit processome, Utp12 protein n=1 Tax=Septoria linicola TaxID=215465 RepID=A0A9Q9EGC3_9PEZI|nr:putative small-subunit processome, Utp12 protein [Septoria linicola]USW48632.1 Putative small-subunit processome, Utp12 protein [Septoria linicola]